MRLIDQLNKLVQYRVVCKPYFGDDIQPANGEAGEYIRTEDLAAIVQTLGIVYNEYTGEFNV